MKSLKLDSGQRAAYEVDKNVVVSAGAGSGKTTVLAERYVRLVTERGLNVDSILTLTFTRKAAAEMYARIYKRLSDSNHPRARAQLAEFDTARIMTLDAFCANVARGACHRYGVPPDFSIDEARLERIADEAAVEVLMDRREEDALRRLVATRSFDRIRKDFLVDLAVGSVSLVTPPSFEEDARRQAAFLEKRIGEVRDEIERVGEEILRIDETGATGVTLPKAKDAVRKVLPLPRDIAALDVFAETARFLSSKESFSKPSSNSQQAALVELRELTVPLKDGAKELRILVESLRFRDDALSVGRTLDDFAGRFLARKRREGLVSFRDAAELAVDILTRDVELRGHYKSRIRAIMIDEFQDNNELQKNLLYLLAERDDLRSDGIPGADTLAPDKLFFVGDEKQSIYRFRGADVSVFRRLAAELDPGGQAALALSVNYRSSSGLVSFFNSFFPGVFGEAKENFEAAFSSIETRRSGGEVESPPAEALSSPAVEFHTLVRSRGGEGEGDEEDAELSAAASEAFAAALRVAEGVEKNEFAYGDVAVLFRSTARQHEYERAFRLLGIPFAASDPRGIFAEGPANDIYSLLRLTLFPGDRNAYAAALRSPFVRLGDDSLVRIFLDERREPFPEEADEAWFAGEDDARRFGRGRDLYRALLSMIDRTGTAEVIAYLWYDAGYRASILENPDAATCLGHFDVLYDLALDADGRGLSLGAFLDELAPLMGTSQKTGGGDPVEGIAAVKFMTVHKSKGLEFPVVLIADAGNEGRGLRNSLPYYRDHEFGVAVTFRPENAARDDSVQNYFFERARAAEEARETAELRRLLYVAATRAERRLLMFGTRRITAKEAEEFTPLSVRERAEEALRMLRIDRDGNTIVKSFLDLVAAGLSADNERMARFRVFPLEVLGERERRRLAYRATAGKSKAATLPGTTLLDEFFARKSRPIPVEARRRTSASAMEAAAFEERGGAESGRKLRSLDIDGLIKGTAMETVFGTLCHHLIERRIAGGSEDIPGKLSNALDILAPAEIESVLATARALTEDFICSDLGREAIAAERRYAEFPFLLALPTTGRRPYLVNGTIDLIYELDGRCVIVDFKTDHCLDPASHAVQMATYRAAAVSFSDLPVESWLFYLREAIPFRDDTEIPLDRLAELAGRAATAASATEDD